MGSQRIPVYMLRVRLGLLAPRMRLDFVHALKDPARLHWHTGEPIELSP